MKKYVMASATASAITGSWEDALNVFAKTVNNGIKKGYIPIGNHQITVVPNGIVITQGMIKETEDPDS